MAYAALVDNRTREEVDSIDRELLAAPRTRGGKPVGRHGGGYGGKLMALMGQLDRPGKSGSGRGPASPAAARQRKGRP